MKAYSCMTMRQDNGTDSPVMTLRAALQAVERGGMIEYSLGGHSCTRPPDVQQGKADDSFDIVAEADNPLLWRANGIPQKQLKAINVASHFACSALEASPLLLAA